MTQFFPRMIPPKPSYRSRNHTVIAEQLREIGWLYKHAASFFNRHEITVARWAIGEYEPLPAERYMLQLLADNPAFRDCVKEIWAAPHRGLCRLPTMQLVVKIHEPLAADEVASPAPAPEQPKFQLPPKPKPEPGPPRGINGRLGFGGE